MRILSNWLIAALALPYLIALGGCGSKEHKNIVEAMCEYVPDHGLRDDAEWHLTPSYFNAYSEAWDAPRPDGLERRGFKGSAYGKIGQGQVKRVRDVSP